MRDISRLSDGAVRLLLAAVLVGAAVSTVELKQRSGVRKRQTVYSAITELEGEGYVEVERNPGKSPVVRVLSSIGATTEGRRSDQRERSVGSSLKFDVVDNAEPRKDLNLDLIRGRAFEASEQYSAAQADSALEPTCTVEGYTPPVPANGTPDLYRQTVHVPANGTPPVPLNGTRTAEGYTYPYRETVHVPANGTPPSLLEMCEAADQMDDSGLETARNSPFQVRRRAQVEAVQAVWKHFFGKDLIRDNVVQLLRLRYNEAAEVYHLLEYAAAKNPESPFGYTLAVAKNKAERFGGKSVMTSPTPQSAEADGEALEEPTEEYRAKAERARRLKAQLWGEDD